MANTTTSTVFVLTRLYWMMLGPFLLAIMALAMIRGDGEWFSPSSVSYLVFLAGLPLARWWELRTGNAKNSAGEPATAHDIRKYAVIVAIAGLAVWAAALAIGNYLT
jgi:hypothetical protein